MIDRAIHTSRTEMMIVVISYHKHATHGIKSMMTDLDIKRKEETYVIFYKKIWTDETAILVSGEQLRNSETQPNLL